MAQLVDLVVDGGVLFNVGIRLGDVGFRLVVVVVGDEVLHRVVGEELPKLRAQLGGQGLVVGQHQGGPVHLGNDVCHGEGLARAGDAQQRLLLHACVQALHQLLDGLGLVPRGLVIGHQLEPFRLSLAHIPRSLLRQLMRTYIRISSYYTRSPLSTPLRKIFPLFPQNIPQPRPYSSPPLRRISRSSSREACSSSWRWRRTSRFAVHSQPLLAKEW